MSNINLRRGSITYKLLISVLSSVLMIYAIILVYNYMVTRDSILDTELKNAKNLTTSAANEIDVTLFQAQRIATGIALAVESESLSESEMHSLIKRTIAANPIICGSCLAFEPYTLRKDRERFTIYYSQLADGSLRYSDLSTEEYMYPKYDWYAIPKQLNRPLFCEPYFDEGGGDVVMTTYSVPFYRTVNGKREFWGIATIDIDLSWLTQVVGDIRFYKTGRAFLISKKGTFITYPDTSYIMNKTIFYLSTQYEAPMLNEIAQQAMHGAEGYDELTIKNDMMTKDVFMYYKPLKATGWPIIVELPQREIFASLTRITITMFSIAAIGLILLIVLVIFSAQRITRPLVKLKKVAEEIGKGNFDVELPKTKSAEDEVSKLITAIQSMLKALKKG